MKTSIQRKIDYLNISLLKAIAFPLLFIFFSNTSTAQLSKLVLEMDDTKTLYDIKAAMEPYLNHMKTIQDDETFYAEGGEYSEYQKFINYWEPRLYPHGDFNVAFNADSAFYNGNNNYTLFSDDPWHEVGPFEKPGEQNYSGYGIGPVEYISIFDDGAVTNTNYMLVASLLGGVFYSTNSGESWSCAGTDTQWDESGSSCAIFHPTDHTTWYASTSGNSNSGNSSFIGKAGGIYRTSNEGLDWHKIADYENSVFNKWTIIYKLLILPDNPNVLFAATSGGILKTDSCNAANPTWTNVFNGRAYDIELKPESNNILYATAYTYTDSTWKVLLSNNSGDTWIPMSAQPKQVDSSGIFSYHFTIEVSKAKPNYLYCNVKDYNENLEPPLIAHGAELFYYNFANPGSWTSFSERYLSTFGSGHGFGVDQFIGDSVLISNYVQMSRQHLNSGGLGDPIWAHHYDVEDILYHPYINGEVWACTHGGVEKSIDGGDTWIPKYTGLAVANVEKMATSLTNPEYVLTGLYHDGTILSQSDYEENWRPDWETIFEGDGMRPLIDNINPANMWASYQKGSWLASNNYFVNSTPRNLSTSWNTEGVLNKVNPSVIFRKGFHNGQNEVFKNIGAGDAIVISSFQSMYPGCLVWHLFTPYTNGDYLFVSLKDTLNDHWHLFRTTTANASIVQWQELSIPRNNGSIATVDFDPDNEDIIYLVYSNSEGDDITTYGKRMVYIIDYANPNSPDTTDITRNLPFTSTRSDCIEVDKGNGNSIYLSTEYGVYYTNNDLLNSGFDCWQQFGIGLPNISPAKLEMNYIAGKLRAGTFGRGVWEIPLGCITDESSVTINANTTQTWTTDKSISDILTIEQGAELTILNATIQFSQEGKVIIKPGGSLVLDGATLTKACHAAWHGVQVWGNRDEHQFDYPGHPCAQGKITLKNNAVIENARCAVKLWKPDNNDSTGGIIVARDSWFKNNKRAVEFMPYQNFTPVTGEPRSYNSYFKNCDFVVDDEYAIPGDFDTHISMTEVYNISITGCRFSNQISNAQKTGCAIDTYDAGFRLTNYCSETEYPCTEPNIVRNTFSNFDAAIKGTNFQTNNTVYVNGAIFTNNICGIKLTTVDNATIINSEFNIDINERDELFCENKELIASGVGIQLTGCTGFAIEENNFISDAYLIFTKVIGVSIAQTNAPFDEVYHNQYSNLNKANYTKGKNWFGQETQQGLAFYCNQNTGNQSDFYVTRGEGYSNAGVQSNQGNPFNSAGNQFSNAEANYHFYNGGDHDVDYYYCDTCPGQEPLLALIYNVNKYLTSYTNNCPSHYVSGGDEIEMVTSLTEDDLLLLEQEYTTGDVLYSNIEALYVQLQDGGNTTGELLDIATAQPGDMWELRTQLLGHSPHLSMDVLKQASDKTDVLPEIAIFDIMAANPDELKKKELTDYLKNKEEPMPQYMIDILEEVASGSTYKTVLLSQMSQYNKQKMRAAHDIIRSKVHDTISDMEGLRNWLDNVGGIQADEQIIASYLHEGNTIDALTLAQLMPQLYALEGKELEEHGYYTDMLNLHINLKQQDRNIFMLEEDELTLLEYLADSSHGTAGMQARGLLEFAYGYHYPNCTECTDTTGMKSTAISRESYNNLYGIDISVHPNPAKGWTEFSYTLPVESSEGILHIYDMSGRLVESITISGRQGHKLWDTRNIKTGLYFYTLTVDGMSSTGKVIISK